MKYDEGVSPVLKWAGGKRQLLPKIRKHIPKKYSTYYEPFLGGGAVLFDLQPKKAIVNDLNSELINLYQVIRDNVDELINDLSKHENNADYFYRIRSIDMDEQEFGNLSDVERASRIIYLNKTCFNGLFRVNQSGKYNTPFGNYKNPNIINENTLRAVSKYFNKTNIKFKNVGFEESIKYIKRGAFVYFDPPYDPISPTSSFTDYTNSKFDKEEQIKLRDLCNELNRRGVKFLLSNSSTEFIHELYSEYTIEIIRAKRTINSVGSSRGEVDEVLIRNY